MTAIAIATQLIQAMGEDNGGQFRPTPAQHVALVAGVERMMRAGCQFTPAQIDDFAAAEESEVQAAFGHFDGFQAASDALDAIFNNEDPGQ